MRNAIFTLVAVALLFGFSVIAKAEYTTYTYDLKTADQGMWQTATLFTSADSGYENPTKNNSNVYQTVGKTWKSLNWDWSTATVDWKDAQQGNRSTWTNYGDWVSAAYN